MNIESIKEEDGSWYLNDYLCMEMPARAKSGRYIYVCEELSLVLKIEYPDSLLEGENSQCLTEGICWNRNLYQYEEFAETLCFGCSIGYSLNDGNGVPIYYWSVQRLIRGFNARTQRENLPESPYMTFVIERTREIVRSLWYRDKDLTYLGQYIYIPEENRCVCVDYGRLLDSRFLPKSSVAKVTGRFGNFNDVISI